MSGITPIDPDYLWIQEAIGAYHVSREWLEKNVQSYTIPGNRRIYVKRSEVEAALQPRPVQKDEA